MKFVFSIFVPFVAFVIFVISENKRDYLIPGELEDPIVATS